MIYEVAFVNQIVPLLESQISKGSYIFSTKEDSVTLKKLETLKIDAESSYVTNWDEDEEPTISY